MDSDQQHCESTAETQRLQKITCEEVTESRLHQDQKGQSIIRKTLNIIGGNKKMVEEFFDELEKIHQQFTKKVNPLKDVSNKGGVADIFTGHLDRAVEHRFKSY